MSLHPLAGKPAPKNLLIDVAALTAAYYGAAGAAPVSGQQHKVAFGTSGHRGTALDGSFLEKHVLAITLAVCEYRKNNGINGPLFVGKDTHALSAPAERSALQVLAANAVHCRIQAGDGYTPTPVISHAILCHNRANPAQLSDGLIITPSHNPPGDAGIKYNPPHGGPADTEVTNWIQDRANAHIESGLRELRLMPYAQALGARTTEQYDYVGPYVRDLSSAVDIEAIKSAKLAIGVDPLGGAALSYWQAIAKHYDLQISIVNQQQDPTFGFMTLDHDGKIRMDCSSPYAMASLVALREQFDIAIGNDPDADRHGIVTRAAGLMNPNHYLAVAIDYLLTHRPQWPLQAKIGKTVVSSSLIDRVVAGRGRQLCEVPVGFKWFAGGLHDGSFCFGGEESAGASFLRRDGRAWTTDKDGILLGLLAAEVRAVTGKDPGSYCEELMQRYGRPYYTRIDTPLTAEQKRLFSKLTPERIAQTELAGDAIVSRATKAPGNNASIGGLKVCSARGWFAARPSGTENIYKLYAESFVSAAHLERIVADAQELVRGALASSEG
jgi:phosphoglucomutase